MHHNSRGRLALPLALALLVGTLFGASLAYGQGAPPPGSPVVSPVASPVGSPVAGASPVTAQQAAGRDLSRFDWLEHLPIALGAVLLVVVVDAIVISKVLQARRR